MIAVTPRWIRAVMLAALATNALLPRDAPAATNPRILGVSLVAGHEFTAGTIIAFNASGVAICVSGKCKRALKSQPWVWNVTPRTAEARAGPEPPGIEALLSASVELDAETTTAEADHEDQPVRHDQPASVTLPRRCARTHDTRCD